jgi:hypothetical protein
MGEHVLCHRQHLLPPARWWRRVAMIASRKLYTVVCMVVIAALTGCLASWRDANEYARQFEVSMGEAAQRLSYQDQIGQLAETLATKEPDTFAGLWIEHEPVYRIVVRFTRDPEDTLRPYLEGLPFAAQVEARGARYTMAQLEDIYAQTLARLGALDFGVSSSLSVQENRVEVYVTDRVWFASQLQAAGCELPEGAVLVTVEGGSTARDMDRLLTPPVPGVAFPRQKPVEGIRASMLAELIGTLQPEGECLYVDALHGGERVLPIWPPEFTLRAEGDQLLVIDSEGQIAAQAGQEVYMAGGYVQVTDEWVLQQIPPACQGSHFVVGTQVRPNLRQGAELLSVDVIEAEGRAVLFPHYEPALDEQVTDARTIEGRLVAYAYRRCLHVQSESYGPFTLLWPADWSLEPVDGILTVIDQEGIALAQMDDEVRLRTRAVPHTMDSPAYRQLLDELPGDCIGPTWLVDEIEARP